MCFSSKPKTPKVSNKIPAPEPKLEDEPKGIDFGGEKSGAEGSEDDNSTSNPTRVEREGDSSEVASAMSTAKTAKPKYGLSSKTVRRAVNSKR